MTKSQGFSPRRKEFIKFARAKAHKEGTSFNNALQNLAETDAARAVNMPHELKVRIGRHNATGGWYSDALVVDDGEDQLYDEDVYDFKIDFSDVDNFKRHTDMTISLTAVARPAKRRKAVGKTVEKSHSGMLLDDQEFEIWEDDEFEKCETWEDDWERIHNEERLDTRKPYSSVVRGKDG